MPESTTYGKQQLVEDLARNAGITKSQANAAVNITIALIQEQISHGNRVTIPGFGSWSLSARAARRGVNPQTKRPIQIPAQTAVRFTVGSTLKQAARGPTNDGSGTALERGRSVTPSR